MVSSLRHSNFEESKCLLLYGDDFIAFDIKEGLTVASLRLQG